MVEFNTTTTALERRQVDIHIVHVLPPVVHRRRLHRLLERVAAPGIVVVNAQAAQGKTTLIADHLETGGARFRWMALSPSDADPVHFGEHLIHACQPYSGSANITADLKTEASAGKIITRLFRSLPPDLNLVFDGRDPGYRVVDALDVHVDVLARLATGAMTLDELT